VPKLPSELHGDSSCIIISQLNLICKYLHKIWTVSVSICRISNKVQEKTTYECLYPLLLGFQQQNLWLY